MTREEALTRLRLRSHQAFCEYVENGNQENEEAALDVLAYDTAIAALRGPVPDPETGLVPCGCGGAPMLLDLDGRIVGVMCSECAVSTSADLDAKNIWNAAMGYREDE